jgi:malonyl CoA-acyl carrier protein transacylase
MYNSIVGEKKWQNALGSSSLDSVNSMIDDVTAQLAEATRLFNQASAALTACKGLSQSACLQKTGGYAHSTWSPQYDNNKAKIPELKTQLADLLKTQQTLIQSQQSSAITTTQVAEANQKAANADVATTGATATKWVLYAGIGVGVIALVITGIVLFKKYKTKL